MPNNPFLKKLGFAEDDRVVIFHADDVGMCQSSIAAFQEMIEVGPLTSGAVMVPCPWFLEAAAYCRERPGTDLGVHLTFTSEWERYRWGPISTRDAASGLMDAEGCFYHTAEDAQKHANPDAILPEVIAQVERALSAGIDATHIDTHMGTMFHPNFIDAYLEAGRRYKLPLMLLRMTEERRERWKENPTMIETIERTTAEAEADGFPIIDHIFQMPLREPDNRLGDVTQTLDALESGLTHFIVHPTKDTAEARAISADYRGRVADYRTFIHDDLRDYLAKSDIQVIGFKEVRDAMR